MEKNHDIYEKSLRARQIIVLFMPFAQNEGVKIHYQVEGEGSPIILITGFPGSMEFWYQENYVESLKEKYQLILIDKRGHGKSSKPHNPEDYLQEKFSSDVIAVMDDLQIDKAHFWGYSFGGYVGIILAKYHPERFHTFILGGVSPQEVSKEQLETLSNFYESLRGGLKGYITSLEKQGIEISLEYRKKIESWDFDALNATTMAEDLFQNMEPQLLKLDIPVLFYAGEKDGWYHHPRQVEFGKKMKNAKVVGIPGYGHEVSRAKDLVIPHVIEFLGDLSL